MRASSRQRTLLTYGKTCRKCNGRNHFAACCCSDAIAKSGFNKVNSIDTKLSIDNHLEEDFIELQQCCYVINNSNHTFPPEGAVILQLENSNAIKFQVDTGNDINMLPLNICKAAT